MRQMQRSGGFARGLVGAALAAAVLGAWAQALPAAVQQALKRAEVPESALAVVVQPVDGGPPRLAYNERAPMNPASLVKLATTAAALELLGPAYVWRTPVWVQGTLRDGVLEGSVHLRGSGDPALTVERLWLGLRRLRQHGVREIRGDIVIDRSAFAASTQAAGDFDGEPLRPHNVQPDAMLLNLRSLVLTFTPDPARGVATVATEPPLAGVAVDANVPLATGPCNDWRGALEATFADPARIRLAGRYAAACGERTWPLAYADPATYDARLLAALWGDVGGRLDGRVRDGAAPEGAPAFELVSPPLAEVVRGINKFSNNVMAQQLLLTMAAQRRQPATAADGRELLAAWLAERTGEPAAEIVIDNGSGLSRSTRVSARALAALLQASWRSPTMPELASSLPLAGQDGTMRRSTAPAGRAHMKTGSLRDVAGVAGWVLGQGGRRYVVVALINHPQANAARAALDAVIQWAADDGPERKP